MFGMPTKTPITIVLGLILAMWLISSAIAERAPGNGQHAGSATDSLGPADGTAE